MSYRLAHVYVDTGSESVDIFGGPIKALRRISHVAAINTCSAITTLTCSSSKLGQINASLSTPIGEVGQKVEIWIETEGGVTLPVFLRAWISAITSDGPFTVIEAEPECSILQSYTAGARDADGTSYSGEVTVCSVMRELATIRLGEVSDPSTHIDREYGVVADSTGTVMGSTSSWTYPTPPATRADLLMRLSRLSAWPNLEGQTVQPMVFYPHHGGRTLTITRYGNGYYDEVAPVKTISKSEGHIIGRIEHTPEDVDNITNKALIQFQDRNRLNLVFPSSIDKYGAREERINAKELEVTEDVIRLAQGIAYLHGLPSSAISLTARYDRIVSDVHRGLLNRTYRVVDRQAGEDVDLGEHVVVRYELDMPSFRVHLRLRKRGWTEADLSGLLAGTGRRIDKLEKASLDTSTLANVTAAREAATRGAVESLNEYVSGTVVPAHNSLANDVSSLRSSHNTLVGDVSNLASAHNSLSGYVSDTLVPAHNALANDVSTHTHDGTAKGGAKISYNDLVDKPEVDLSTHTHDGTAIGGAKISADNIDGTKRARLTGLINGDVFLPAGTINVEYYCKIVDDNTTYSGKRIDTWSPNWCGHHVLNNLHAPGVTYVVSARIKKTGSPGTITAGFYNPPNSKTVDITNRVTTNWSIVDFFTISPEYSSTGANYIYFTCSSGIEDTNYISIDWIKLTPIAAEWDGKARPPVPFLKTINISDLSSGEYVMLNVLPSGRQGIMLTYIKVNSFSRTQAGQIRIYLVADDNTRVSMSAGADINSTGEKAFDVLRTSGDLSSSNAIKNIRFEVYGSGKVTANLTCYGYVF